MKILFISDIHGIKTNLGYIRGLDEKEKFDKIVVLGDLYYYPRLDNNSKNKYDGLYVKDFLTSYQDRLICLRGNCDSDVDVKSSDFPICDDLVLIRTDEIDIYCTHGNEYSYDKSNKFNYSGVLVYGHEHYPYIRKKDNIVFINTGSISLPKNNSKPSYLIYENRKFRLCDIEENIIDEIIV